MRHSGRLARRTPLRSKTRIRPVAKKPKRSRLTLSPGEYAELRLAVFERANKCCEECGHYAPMTSSPISGGQMHHRTYRSHGGPDSLENCIWLCGACHSNHHNGGKPCPQKDGTRA